MRRKKSMIPKTELKCLFLFGSMKVENILKGAENIFYRKLS
jgi:hypothetical protein